MVCFKDVVFALALSVTALTLAGCGSAKNGGGGNSPSPPPGPEPPKPADLVSQSVEGTIQGTETTNGTKPVTIPAEPFALYIDADKMNVRVDGSGSVTVNEIKAHAKLKAIVDVAQKRITYFMNTTVMDKTTVNCSYFTVKQMPAADTLRQLIKSVLGSQTVTRAKDGNKQMTIDVDPSIVSPKAKGTVDVTVELGDDNVLHKVIEDASLTEPVQVKTVGTLTTTKTSAGTPDASYFVADKSWGDCTERPPPSLYEDLEAFSTHISLPLKLVFQMMQIKPEIETQSELIAI